MLNVLLGRAEAMWHKIVNARARYIALFVVASVVGWLVLVHVVGTHSMFLVLGFLLAAIPVLAVTGVLLRRASAANSEYDTGRLDAIERKIDHLHSMEGEMVAVEKRLTEQVTRYEMVFKHVLESILIISADTGDIVDFNDSAARSLGYTRDEFRELRISDFDANDTEADVLFNCAYIVKKRCLSFETTHVNKAGELLPAHCSSSVIRSNGDTLLQTICRYGE